MTIASTANRNDYTGAGSTDTYSYGFKIFSDTDLLVTQKDDAGVETTLVLDTDYTVTGAGNTGGGTIVLTAGNLPADYHLTIRRVRPLTQNTDIRNQGDFYAEIHEDAFDHFVMIAQQQQEELDRTVKIPETTTGVDATMPEPEALHWARWDATGTAMENVNAADMSILTTVGSSLTLTAGDLSVTDPVLHGVAAGAADVITATVSPAPASLTNNLEVCIEMLTANATTTPTFELNSLGAKTIVKGSNEALQAGDIPGANFRARMAFDTSLDKWVLLNPHAPSTSQVQAGAFSYAVDTGAADAYVAALSPAPAALTVGMIVGVKIINANLTTTPTLNLNGLGAVVITRNSGALNAGDIKANGYSWFMYYTTGWMLLNPILTGTADLVDSSVTSAKVADGAVVQVVNYQTGAYASGTTVIPADDTIPQNTEGDEYMTLAITPKSTTNKLLIEAIGQFRADGSPIVAMALFQDATADALNTVTQDVDSSSAAIDQFTLSMRHYMTAGTASETTFKIRAGRSGAGTLHFNGNASGRLYGGIMISSITITEIKAS